MKKVLAVVLLLICSGAAQAQYGNTVSQYTYPFNEWILNYNATQYTTFGIALDHWLGESKDLGSILRVGYVAGGGEPVSDVRLVVSNGDVICASSLVNGCNGH